MSCVVTVVDGTLPMGCTCANCNFNAEGAACSFRTSRDNLCRKDLVADGCRAGKDDAQNVYDAIDRAKFGRQTSTPG